MSARAALRARTAAEHERVDRLFSNFTLGEGGSYRRFLLAQAAAFLPIESALDRGGAADLLGIVPNTLDGRMRKLGIKKEHVVL